MPVRLSNGIAEKKQSNIHTQGVSGHPYWLLGGTAQGTEPRQLLTGVVCWNSIGVYIGWMKSYDYYMKRM